MRQNLKPMRIDELINDCKTEWALWDLQAEEMLEKELKDWAEWSKKSLYKSNRAQYMDIISKLKRELEHARAKNHITSARAVGFKLGRNTKENRNTRNTD